MLITVLIALSGMSLIISTSALYYANKATKVNEEFALWIIENAEIVREE